MISVWKAYVTFNMIARDPEVIKKNPQELVVYKDGFYYNYLYLYLE